MVRLEWADVVAFDEAKRPKLTEADMEHRNGLRIRRREVLLLVEDDDQRAAAIKACIPPTSTVYGPNLRDANK